MSCDSGYLGGEQGVSSGGHSGREGSEECETVVTDHPLLNPLIMSRILKLLEGTFTLDGLKDFRSVCKLWHDLSIPLWHPLATLHLGPPPPQEFKPPNPEHTAKPEEYNKCLPITDFLKFYHNPDTDPYNFQGRPFTKYVLCGVTIEKSDLLGAPNGDLPEDLPLDTVSALDKLWNIIGPIAEDFTFKQCVFSEEAQNENFKKIISKKLPKLKRLALVRNRLVPQKIKEEREQWFHSQLIVAIAEGDYTPFNEHLKILEVDGETPMEGFELLINSLKLETVKMRNDIKLEYTLPCLMYLWNVLHTNGEGRIPCLLKNLDVIDSSFLADSFYPLGGHLARAHLPLERMSLSLEPVNSYLNDVGQYHRNASDDIARAFIPILEHHKDTLQVLKAFRPPVFDVPVTPPFQIMMPQMRELYLWGNIVDSFSFLRFLPNLKILHLNHDCYGRGEELQKLYFPEDKSIQIFRRRYRPFSDNMLGRMTILSGEEIMLELMEELELDISEMTPAIIKCLARWMPNLKIFRGNLNKATFPAVCKWMPSLEELVALFQSDLDDGVITGRGDRDEVDVNNITRLTGLKRFLWKPRCDNDGGLGEDSIHHGFLHLKASESLIAPVSEHMREETEATLKQQVSRVKFIRNYGPNPHQEFDKCCQRNYFSSNILLQQFAWN